jgi:hypothetical protein
MYDNQHSKYVDQPTPTSAKTKEASESTAQKYVVLPHHPLYGCLVTIIRRQVATTYVKCTIEDPAHPSFRYQIREHWLSSSQPPPLPISPTPNEAICLPLSALDTMVQRLLTTPYFRRIMDDEQTCHSHSPSQSPSGSASGHLAPTSSEQPDATPASPLLPGAQPSRRD